MSINVNRHEVIGNLTDNPDLRYTPGGKAVAEFTVASNRSWKDKDGNRQERVEFVPCVVWGKAAEAVAQYCQKGRQVRVVGESRTRNWIDKRLSELCGEDVRRYKTELVATEPVGFGAEPKSKAGQTMDPDQEEPDYGYDDLPA